MKVLFFSSILALVLSTEIPVSLNRPVLTEEDINHINSIQSSWVAKANPMTNLLLSDVVSMFKTVEKPQKVFQKYNYDSLEAPPPSSFDASVTWPTCVVPVYDQGSCSASYAFAVAAAASERLCITNPKIYTGMNFSPQYLAMCGVSNQKCGGGYVSEAWSDFSVTGTGVMTCQPWTGNLGCSNVCANGTPVTIYKVDPNSITELMDAASIQQSIMRSGAIATNMALYNDFLSYSSGIYVKTGASPRGSITVKIFGWGTNGTVSYWIGANSWGTSWGMNGLFWIMFGQCGIEDNAYIGAVTLN